MWVRILLFLQSVPGIARRRWTWPLASWFEGSSCPRKSVAVRASVRARARQSLMIWECWCSHAVVALWREPCGHRPLHVQVSQKQVFILGPVITELCSTVSRKSIVGQPTDNCKQSYWGGKDRHHGPEWKGQDNQERGAEIRVVLEDLVL